MPERTRNDASHRADAATQRAVCAAESLYLSDYLTFGMCVFYAVVNGARVGRDPMRIGAYGVDRSILSAFGYIAAAAACGGVVKLLHGVRNVVAAWVRALFGAPWVTEIMFFGYFLTFS